ncbi:FAD-binding domain-containing protein [Gigaspora margarita]|uniref:FAD-binding domain-containing protein n=1 Tax=Gigaspora margarita TaxID=4874 RepID=A0A8H4B0Q6_GIGMA|nr:FAD-binding domain-containing protein [Gigaspora margarita]
MVINPFLSLLLILIISTVYKSVAVSINKDFMIRSATPIDNKSWENWNGTIDISPNTIFEPSTLKDLIVIVKLAKKNHKDVLPKGMPSVHCTSLAELDQALRTHNPPLTLNSETVFDVFRVGGVIAVGAHGAKTSSGIISDQLCSMQIVTGSGEVCEFSEEINKSEFNATKVNLSLLGIIYSDGLVQKNIKTLLKSSDGIELLYWPFNGFNQSDSNPLDPNRDLVWVKNWVRTDKPVSLSQQQLEQVRETQRQGLIQQNQLIISLLQTPEATPNITATIWDNFISSEFGFKVDPDFSNVATELLFAIQANHKINQSFETAYRTPSWEEFGQLMVKRYFDKYKAKPHWPKEWEFIPNVDSYLSNILLDQIKKFEKVRAKHNPDKIFFDNKSLQDTFSKALGSKNQ